MSENAPRNGADDCAHYFFKSCQINLENNIDKLDSLYYDSVCRSIMCVQTQREEVILVRANPVLNCHKCLQTADKLQILLYEISDNKSQQQSCQVVMKYRKYITENSRLVNFCQRNCKIGCVLKLRYNSH